MSRRRADGWCAVALVAAVLLSLLPATHAPAAPALHDAWNAMQLVRPKTPIQAPTFVLEDLRGRPVSLGGLRGRAVVLYFWATW
ncbi:MAG: hypothetical protein A3F92_00685 [Candidatus Rokubacteria bacterium RIFCSPLOWO2_12_FULL_71_22]|nr:MAG: hypothetical protein A3F92_00685 [Candidatus Rokubacteria bacterium RIFCSPLOWO2_12_FULL_71_22]